jgi:hypothetical protein
VEPLDLNTLEIDREFFTFYFHELFNSLNSIGCLTEAYEGSEHIGKDELIDDIANIHDSFNTALLLSQKFKIVNNPKNNLFSNLISSTKIEKEVSIHFPLLPENVTFKFNHKTEKKHPDILMQLVHSIFYLCLHNDKGQLLSDQKISCEFLTKSISITASNNQSIGYLTDFLDRKKPKGRQVSSIQFELIFLNSFLSNYSIKSKATNTHNFQLKLNFPES